MVNCCIPICTSHSGNAKARNVKFYEFPSNEEVRKRWLQNIHRANWIPNDSSRICSLHFQPSDFKEGGVRQKLLPNTVPTIFEGHPSYLQVAAQKTYQGSHQKDELSLVPTEKRVSSRGTEAQFIADKSVNDSTACALMDSDFRDFKELQGEICPVQLEETGLQYDWNSSKVISSACTTTPTKYPVKGRPPLTPCRIKKSIKKIRKKNERLTKKIRKLSEDGRKYKICIKKYKHPLHQNVRQLKLQAEHNISAQFLLDQLLNYNKKRPKYSETTIRYCIVWQNKSPRGYEFARHSKLLTLPCRTTLLQYTGSTSGETGVTSLIKKRLSLEIKELPEVDRLCSLVIDEMAIKPSLTYCKYLDRMVGAAENVDKANMLGVEQQIANHLLCFVMTGLTTRYHLPVAYYFTRDLIGDQLHVMTLDVMKEVESFGFRVLRIYTDDLSVNTKMFHVLCGGKPKAQIIHPLDKERIVFLSYDYCHIIKNVRSQLLCDTRFLRNNGESIDPAFIRRLYELQKHAILKPVRALTRKHVYPTNLEKMSVLHAIQLFMPAVTAATKFLSHHASHLGFCNVNKTGKFLETFYTWFQVMDVHNTKYHIHQRAPQKAPFLSIDDSRLDWLETTFLDYLKNWKALCKNQKEFLTTEMYSAIILTTKSTVSCIRFLLESGTTYILTRKFSSDNIERLFSSVRQLLGSNDQAYALGVVNALEKMLQTGLLTPSRSANVKTVPIIEFFPKSPFALKRQLKCSYTRSSPAKTGENQPYSVECLLTKLSTTAKMLYKRLENPPQVPASTIHSATTALIAGYLVRVVHDRHECADCETILCMPPTNIPIAQLIRAIDRGGLMYPKPKFVYLVAAIHDFFVEAFPIIDNKNVAFTLGKLINKQLKKHAWLACTTCPEREDHTELLHELILSRLLKILLQSFGEKVSDKLDWKKFSHMFKPLSRKSLKL